MSIATNRFDSGANLWSLKYKDATGVKVARAEIEDYRLIHLHPKRRIVDVHDDMLNLAVIDMVSQLVEVESIFEAALILDLKRRFKLQRPDVEIVLFRARKLVDDIDKARVRPHRHEYVNWAQ